PQMRSAPHALCSSGADAPLWSPARDPPPTRGRTGRLAVRDQGPHLSACARGECLRRTVRQTSAPMARRATPSWEAVEPYFASSDRLSVTGHEPAARRIRALRTVRDLTGGAC